MRFQGFSYYLRSHQALYYEVETSRLRVIRRRPDLASLYSLLALCRVRFGRCHLFSKFEVILKERTLQMFRLLWPWYNMSFPFLETSVFSIIRTFFYWTDVGSFLLLIWWVVRFVFIVLDILIWTVRSFVIFKWGFHGDVGFTIFRRMKRYCGRTMPWVDGLFMLMLFIENLYIFIL
mgnify:CR=1 FL=1